MSKCIVETKTKVGELEVIHPDPDLVLGWSGHRWKWNRLNHDESQQNHRWNPYNWRFRSGESRIRYHLIKKNYKIS